MRYKFGAFILDDQSQRLYYDDEPVLALQPLTYRVLESLIKRANHPVSKEELSELWPPHITPTEAAIYTCIRDARRAIGDNGRPPHDQYIQTAQRYGWRFTADVQQVIQPAPPIKTVVDRQRIRIQIENMRGRLIRVSTIAVTLATTSWLVHDECELLCTTGAMERISENMYRHRC
jgi:DNA-binding winged helix-turn-helix (wHTH) protein